MVSIVTKDGQEEAPAVTAARVFAALTGVADGPASALFDPSGVNLFDVPQLTCFSLERLDDETASTLALSVLRLMLELAKASTGRRMVLIDSVASLAWDSRVDVLKMTMKSARTHGLSVVSVSDDLGGIIDAAGEYTSLLSVLRYSGYRVFFKLGVGKIRVSVQIHDQPLLRLIGPQSSY